MRWALLSLGLKGVIQLAPIGKKLFKRGESLKFARCPHSAMIPIPKDIEEMSKNLMLGGALKTRRALIVG